MTDYNKVGETAQALLPTFQQFMPTTDPDVAKEGYNLIFCLILQTRP